MAEMYAVKKSDLTAIADAIRRKTGDITEITVDEMPTQIGSIDGDSRDWSELGYSKEPSFIDSGFEYAKSILANWDPTQIDLYRKFNSIRDLVFMPNVDTSTATSMNQMFTTCTGLIHAELTKLNSVVSTVEMFINCYALRSVKFGNFFSLTNAQNMFRKCYALKDVSIESLPSLQNAEFMFGDCASLENIIIPATPNVTNMASMFVNCTKLKNVTLLDTSNVTSMYNMFAGSQNIENVTFNDTSKVTNMAGMFGTGSTSYMTSAPVMDTSSVTTTYHMFEKNHNLTTIPLYDFSSNVNLASMFSYCTNLTNLGGFKDLGKSYDPSAAAGFGEYSLNLSVSSKITHDSLMNVINNLYDIASLGCNIQKLIIGNTNKNKLTAEEIAIATNKGWSVE